MKRSTLTFFLSMAAAMGFGVSANADLLYTFNTGAGATTGDEAGGQMVSGTYTWTTYYGGEVQHTATTGGWNLGGTGPKFEFSWPAQSVMWGIQNGALGPNPIVSFDITVTDDWSFNQGGWIDWAYYQLHWAFNSGGGWQQDTGVWTLNPGSSFNYDATNTHGGNNHTEHVDASFAAAGWSGAGGNWYQIFFGSNSDAGNPVQFFVDNIQITPEPTTLALAGLGAAALLIARKRQ